jgi:hypothetical protein
MLDIRSGLCYIALVRWVIKLGAKLNRDTLMMIVTRIWSDNAGGDVYTKGRSVPAGRA